MNYRTLLFFFLIISEFKSHALIVQSTNITDLLTHLGINTTETLVIFDIDNVIAEPCWGREHKSCELGSDQWFMYQYEKEKKNGSAHEQALSKTADLYHKIQHHVGFKAVEECTPHMISELQKQGITIIALTMRSIALADRTIKQLHHLGIDFIHSAPHKSHIDLPTHVPTLYKEGVIFANCKSKSKALLAFFNHINFWPTKIIFIDDKLKNLEDVEQAVTELGIQFLGIRYGRTDGKVENFDHAAAEKQLADFLVACESARQ